MGVIDCLCPFVEDTPGHLIWTSWHYKDSLRYHNRVVTIYLQLLLFTAIAFVPLWILGPFESTYYVAKEANFCTWENGTVITEKTYPADEPKHCPRLTDERVKEGWMLSPVQRHAQRYGRWYYYLTWTHVTVGHGLVLAGIFLTVSFVSGWVGSQTSEFHRTRRKISAIVHYWIFMHGWLLNITAALVMAYTRFLTLGPDATHWKWMFSMGFFFLFYFVVVITLLSLLTLFREVRPDYTVIEIYMHRLAQFCGQGMFLMLIPTVLCVHFNEKIRKTLGFSTYDVIIITIVCFYMIEPFIGTVTSISTSSNRYYRAISSCTIYFISLLTSGINFTYKKFPEMTVPVLLVLAIHYIAALVWTFARISFERKCDNDAAFKESTHGTMTFLWSMQDTCYGPGVLCHQPEIRPNRDLALIERNQTEYEILTQRSEMTQQSENGKSPM
eukprot:gnl/TRDRNA2_/TRDRNA2_197871_c0_seq1.p1 gnl/TRDRNA2_/TRDRNA2_197871_c0~~gnl/TRDRNA2_/TRDRNA2_197871_c0_seq1.p1  ORF type:complete len:442 (+),score=35.55 gnl/TRDRNA2_/TRDRNA2_197871_c0_seq1:40-1365(+)